jgi:alpha-mannosidase
VRVSEMHGVGARFRLTTQNGFTRGYRTNLLEGEMGESLVDNGVMEDVVEGFDTSTYRLRWRTPAKAAVGGNEPALLHRPLSVPANYWRHNQGPAPIGNLPVSVCLDERAVYSHGGWRVGVVVASSKAVEVVGTLRAVLVNEGAVDDPVHRLRLSPEGWDRLQFTLRPATPITESLAVTAEFDVGNGTKVCDSAIYDRDGMRGSSLDLGSSLRSRWKQARYDLKPGHETVIELEVLNANPFTVMGDCQLVSPWGTWGWLSDWSQTLRVLPGTTTELGFPLRPHTWTEAMDVWATSKLCCFGAATFSPTVRLVVQRP